MTRQRLALAAALAGLFASSTLRAEDTPATPPDAGKKWRGPYVKELRPDPWGNSYQYRSPGQYGAKTYDLWSNGADSQPGGEGNNEDVTNWTSATTE